MSGLKYALPAGYQLDHYTIDSVLGIGGFSITYRARDELLQQWVAIKEYFPTDFAGRRPDGVAVQPRVDGLDNYLYGLERFLDEARTLARFQHPNIVRVYRFIEANGTAYLIMEWQQGQTLAQSLSLEPSPSEARIRSIFLPLLSGLVEVHRAQFLHRDIKPDNIYLRQRGEPMLIDFGSARQAIGSCNQNLTRILSPGYAPPEQYSSDARKQDTWTDLYALGGCLYRCVSGKTPIDSPQRAKALNSGAQDPLSPAVVVGRGRYSESLLQLIDQLLVASYHQRPSSTEAVLVTLRSGQALELDATMPFPRPVEGALEAGSEAAAAGTVFVAAPPNGAASEGDHSSGAGPVRRGSTRWRGIFLLSAVVAIGAVGAWLWSSQWWPARTPLGGVPQLNAQGDDVAGLLPSSEPASPETRAAPGARGADQNGVVESGVVELAIDAPAEQTAPLTAPGNLAKSSAARRDEPAVGPDQPGRQLFQLRKLTQGRLAINTQPADARVILPDIVPRYERNMALTAGSYRIVVKASGHRTWTGRVTLKAGELAVLDVELERASPAARAGPVFYDALRDGSAGPALVGLPVGSYMMGDLNRRGVADERPAHAVSIGRPLAIMIHEVTFDDYDRYARATGQPLPDDEGWGRGTRPVINVSWQDARNYANWLSEQTGRSYRLPSEAEWEYAARAGTSRPYPWGNEASHDAANYGTNECCDGLASGADRWEHTAPVGSFPANPWGLHDLHGNVYEWTEDCYRASYIGAPGDGSAMVTGACAYRVLRGGSWDIYPLLVRSADRFWLVPTDRDDYVGFRLVRDLGS